jgi:hypothetical protein
VQLLDPWCARGANRSALVQAQANYARFGAMERRFLGNVKGIRENDVRDPTWRSARHSDRTSVRAPRELSEQELRDLTAWYYWRRHEVQGASE